jgi:hypothetical protein
MVGKEDLTMKKLTLRLLVLILSVYLAGSIYPLLAHEVGHPPAPAPAPAPAPPRPPAPVPSAPSMLDTKGGPPPTLTPPSTTPSRSPCDSTRTTVSTPTGPDRENIQKQIEVQKELVKTYTRHAEQYEKTAAECRRRASGPITAETRKWLENHTASTATGYRGPAYQNAPPAIQKEMDDFEKLHPSRDGTQSGTLLFATVFGGGKKGLLKGQLIVEATRATQFAKQLRQKAQAAQQEAQRLENMLH